MTERRMDFDLIIIGGGSAGSATARRAREYGATVCLIEQGPTRDPMTNKRTGAGCGGTCVNVGCVPKKLMYYAGHHRELLKGSASTTKGYGTNVDLNSLGDFDWAEVKRKRDRYVNRLESGYKSKWEKVGVCVLIGKAKIDGFAPDGRQVQVVCRNGDTGEETRVHGKNIIVAVGGSPRMPNDVPGSHEYCIDSDDFFDLEQQPKKAAVIGAGYIAVEMAGILNALGTDTTIFCRGETVLRRGFDKYIVDALMAEMKKHGPNVCPFSKLHHVRKENDGSLTLVMRDWKEHSGFDCVLFAIGRIPATSSLGMSSVGAAVSDKSGKIRVDELQRCVDEQGKVIPGVHALGDVAERIGDEKNGWELTPVAIAAGRRLADRLYGGEPASRLVYSDIPTVVFSHPPIGVVGMTESDAVNTFGRDAVRVKKASFPSMLYAFQPDNEHKVKTYLKLVLAGDDERVVGLHTMGPGCDEMLQGFAVAIKMGATRADFESCVAIHPTAAEELVTMGGWGQDVNKKPLLPRELRKGNISLSWGFFSAGVLAGIAIALVGLRRGSARL